VLLAATSGTLIGFTPGQALASHVTCGDLITTDTTLDSDLVGCPGDGLVIGADDVTLDLAGHVVSGQGWPGESAGVDNTAGHQGVTVEGGTIRAFGSAVHLAGATGNRLLRISADTASETQRASIVLDRSRGNVVQHNSLRGHPHAVALSDSDGNEVVANRVEGSAGIGLADGSAHNRIAGNDIVIQYDAGVSLSRSDHNSIDGNSVVNCGSISCYGGFGIRIVASDHVSVTDNSIVQLYSGIVLTGSDHNHVERNRVDSGGAYDAGDGNCQICVTDSDANRVAGNAMSRAHSYGALVDGTSAANWLVGNTTHRGDLDGIRVEADTRRTLLKDNVANDGRQDGIHVESARTTLSGNTANGNYDLGIEAVAGATDAGGNTAFGNGNPLQCLNVSCNATAGRGQ
jgi:parallel beta-helix repeat protein